MTTTACLLDDELERFATGGADAATTARVEAHVDGCDDCRELLGETLRAFGVPPAGAGQNTARLGDPVPPGPDDEGLAGTLLSPGTLVGRYVIEGPLGAGGMGVVYLARDPHLRRKVALKLLRAEDSDDEGRAQRQSRLLREAQSMARLRHPNVVAVYDVGVYGRGLFVAMELVEGRTAREWLMRERPSWREVLAVMRAAGQGLGAAHDAGIIHRDFKPDNVLLGGDGRVCVTDFGIASSEHFATGTSALPGSTVPMTARGMVLGTPGYMAPEQLHGEPVDERADIFSFCVTLHEALYRQRPFALPTTVFGHGREGPGPVRSPPRDVRVPGWLRRAVLRGLGSAPGDRYASMRELLLALDEKRHRRRQSTAIAGGTAALVVGLSVASLAVAKSRAGRLPATAVATTTDPCASGLERVRAVWNDQRRASVSQAFVATGLPHGADLAAAAVRVLDGFSERWATEHRRACEATWVRREESEEVFAGRARCLGRGLDALSELAEQFAHADAALAEGAITAARRLDEPALCLVAPAHPPAAIAGVAPAATTPVPTSSPPPSPSLRPSLFTSPTTSPSTSPSPSPSTSPSPSPSLTPVPIPAPAEAASAKRDVKPAARSAARATDHAATPRAKGTREALKGFSLDEATP